MTERIQTHNEECWRYHGHSKCAERKVESLTAEVSRKDEWIDELENRLRKDNELILNLQDSEVKVAYAAGFSDGAINANQGLFAAGVACDKGWQRFSSDADDLKPTDEKGPR